MEWLPCPPPGELPDPGIEPMSPAFLHCRHEVPQPSFLAKATSLGAQDHLSVAPDHTLPCSPHSQAGNRVHGGASRPRASSRPPTCPPHLASAQKQEPVPLNNAHPHTEPSRHPSKSTVHLITMILLLQQVTTSLEAQMTHKYYYLIVLEVRVLSGSCEA